MKHGNFSANIISNVANFVLNIIIGIWFTPYLIGYLGVAAYGIIPLAATVVSYLSILTVVLSVTVGRFLTIAIERGDDEEANKIFNTALCGSIFILLLLLFPGACIVFHPEWLLRLPPGYETQIKWLFACTLTMFILTMLAGPFEVATYCRNRFDLRNAISITSTVVKISLVVLLFNIFPARIWHVGIAILAASFISLSGSVLIWRKLTPALKIRTGRFDRQTLKKLTGSGGWIAVNQFGTLLLIGIDLLVINRLFGPDASGRYATLLQWSALLRGLGGAAAGVVGPTILYFYARNDISSLSKYARQSVKFMGLFISLPVGLLTGLSRPLLNVWLGPDFIPFAPLLSLMTIHLCINLGYLPLHFISVATGDVRWPGIIQLVAGVVNLTVALVFSMVFGFGMYGVAAAGAIVLTAKNAVFTPLYSAHILKKGYGIFFREMLPVIAVSVTLSAGCRFFSTMVDLSSWGRLSLFSAFVTLIYGLSVWFIFTDTEERRMILGMIPFAGNVK